MRLNDIGGKLSEGYRVVPGFDKDKYQERQGLEGPFSTKSGKVVYYDKVEGKYYDPDTDMYIEYDDWQAMNEQGVAEGSLNEFAPDGFNGNDGDEFSPEIAKMAQEDGFTKGVSLADGATLERAITINHWHNQHGGMYKQYFAKGFIAGRKEKIRHDNKQYNLNLKLMKDGSIRHGEQGVAEAFGLYGPFTVTINTGERPQSRTKTKKFRREDDAILWAQDWLEDFSQYPFATAEVTDPDGNVVWTTDEEDSPWAPAKEGVAEGSSDRRKQEQEADKWLEKRIMKCTCPTSARNNPKCPVHGKKKGVAEGAFDNYSPMAKDTIKQDKIRSLENLIAIYKKEGRQLRVQELERELSSLKNVSEGPFHNPGQEDSPVAQAITRRILLQRTDLLAKYGPEKVGQAIDEVADFVGDVDEIGSSDVSGWIRHVEQMLGNMGESQFESEGAPKSALGKALWRDLSKFKKASPAQQQRNKERWAQRQAEKNKEVDEGYDKWGWHTSLTNGEFMPTKYGNKDYVYLHDLDNESPRGGPQLVTVNKPTVAKRIARQFGAKVVKTDLNTYRIVKPAEQGVAEGSLAEGQYEMMMRNGQVKKFVAKDDADAKRIAAGHGAKSVIRLKGGVPAGKVSEQGVAEGAKVDRMVKHIAKSEREAGKSAEEAENIAWATANKRGYLDNKNKKAK